jgi:ZIP family zinc transporter
MRPRPGRPTLRAMPVDVWTVTAAAAATALATGLGALPFAVLRNGMRREWLGVSNAVAAGFMLAASVGLVWQGAGLGPWRVVAGGAAGWTCIVLFRRLIGERGGFEVHNIPEGLAISLVLVPRGLRVRSAAAWSVFSSLPQPLIAPFAFLFVESFRPVLPAGLGFAAGAMLWMVWRELLPEALEDAPRRTLALGGGLSFAVMLGAQALVFGV